MVGGQWFQGDYDSFYRFINKKTELDPIGGTQLYKVWGTLNDSQSEIILNYSNETEHKSQNPARS